jgi:predicted site-specific integrase-resolvase
MSRPSFPLGRGCSAPARPQDRPGRRTLRRRGRVTHHRSAACSAIYARVSSARQKEQETISSQLAALRAHAEQLGLREQSNVLSGAPFGYR